MVKGVEVFVLSCGTQVRPKGLEQKAMITAISIRLGRVVYECGYFYNGEYKSVFLEEFEFEVDNAEKVRVGFK